ncbi:MAG TPA: NAD(P)-binding protein [Terriglobia bacterium]|nr:NAD(P)-binding protein [Terriglobia bacterium]
MERGTVFVIGAGPAGLFLTRKIASAGYRVVIFNRDIKPGGLAEYGIYPEKLTMKEGLRRQFAKTLELPNVSYFGNVPIGDRGALSIEEVEEWNPAAIAFAVGAQGNRRLGVTGDATRGVYFAKDFVYHYNRLPPFATQDFSVGRRVGIIGMGNVMVDVARWLLVDMPGAKPDEVVVIARRGPFEARFDRKEFEEIEQHLDRAAFHEELRRIKDRLHAVGQDIEQVATTTFPWLQKPDPGPRHPRLAFRFLTSPVKMKADGGGRVSQLSVVDNILFYDGRTTRAKSAHQVCEMSFDTLIFAIGDAADPTLGLPFWKGVYLTSPSADPHSPAYEVYDPRTGRAMPGHYLVGWARRASEGVVGKAKLDAERGADCILRYLENVQPRRTPLAAELHAELERRHIHAVTERDAALLREAERAEAEARGLTYFRYATNEEMLASISRLRDDPSELNLAVASSRRTVVLPPQPSTSQI